MNARICPEFGSTIKVNVLEDGRHEVHVVDEKHPSIFAEGLVFIALANQEEKSSIDSVIDIPRGTTVEISNEFDEILCRLEVHRNGSPPMFHVPGVFHPNSDKPLYHHIDGNGYFNATRFPNVLDPQVAIWYHDPREQE